MALLLPASEHHPRPTVCLASSRADGHCVRSLLLVSPRVVPDARRVPSRSLVLAVPFLAAAQFAQSTPLILALALIPATRALAILKPNIGLAIFAWRPGWRRCVHRGLVVRHPARILAQMAAALAHLSSQLSGAPRAGVDWDRRDCAVVSPPLAPSRRAPSLADDHRAARALLLR